MSWQYLKGNYNQSAVNPNGRPTYKSFSYNTSIDTDSSVRNEISNSDFYNLGYKNFTLYGRVMFLAIANNDAYEYNDFMIKNGTVDGRVVGYFMGFYEGTFILLLRESAVPNDYRIIFRSDSIDAGVFYDIVAVRVGEESAEGCQNVNNYIIYVNGVAQPLNYNNSGVTNFNFDNPGVLNAPMAAKKMRSYLATGYMSASGIWNRALSESEILLLSDQIYPPLGAKMLFKYDGVDNNYRMKDYSSVGNNSLVVGYTEEDVLDKGSQIVFLKEEGILPIDYNTYNQVVTFTASYNLTIKHIGGFIAISELSYSLDGVTFIPVVFEEIDYDPEYPFYCRIFRDINLVLNQGNTLWLKASTSNTSNNPHYEGGFKGAVELFYD